MHADQISLYYCFTHQENDEIIGLILALIHDCLDTSDDMRNHYHPSI